MRVRGLLPVVLLVATRGMVQTTTVRVDRPFSFFVRDKKTGDILFEGRVATPRP